MRPNRFPKRVFLFLGLAFLLPTLAAAGQTSIFKLKVIVQAANIRSKPDIASAILKTVPAGTLFESPGKEGRWYKVSLLPDAKGTAVTGYVYDTLVEIVGEIKAEPAKVEAPTPPKKEKPVAEKAIPVEKRQAQPEVALPGSRKRSFSLRPYAKLGMLLTPPSAADLNYIEVDGGNLDEFLDVATANFGGGIQLLFSLNPENTMRVGVDLGAQKLFSSVFNLGTSDIVYEDIHNENEFAFYLLALLELRSRRSPVFFQAGAGMHLVSWYWDYTYSGKYHDEYEEESGLEVNMGFLLSGGFDIPVNERISVPIMLRMDGLMRYGMMLNLSLSIGLSFH
ncbi:MAG: SH3 domain-containing protein [Candidatus Aminicenantes bacterium]|nr:SH3 domain-containing protein [Candidatus Aminicenantes bacterium]